MIYMDNSATSYPKPMSVIRAVKKSLNSSLANPGRGTSKSALKASEILYDSRVSLSNLVGTAPENIIFTYNATYALNMAIFGAIKEGMTVAYEPFAHNSVLRPLYALEKKGVSLKLLDADLVRDSVIISSFKRLVSSCKVDFLIVTHTSNVTGKKLPISQLSLICKEHGVKLIVDASQGLGSSNINMREQGIDILASSGHKGLYGIMGSGFLAVSDNTDFHLTPLISGGSGILSLEREMPEALPERLEGGTVGLPAIISMKKGAEYIMRVTPEAIEEKEKALRKKLTEGLSSIKGVKVYNADVNSTATVLFNFTDLSPFDAAALIDNEGIALRAGFHCAPLIHGIISHASENYEGALRLSVGYFNTLSQCDRVINAINKISKRT